MAITAVVCYWAGRRLHRISRLASEGYGSGNDFLATAAAVTIRRSHIFRDLFLSWQRRCFPKLGMAVERRSRYPGIYEPFSTWNACAMDNRFCFNCRWSIGEYVANGARCCPCAAGSHWFAFWPKLVATTTPCAKERADP